MPWCHTCRVEYPGARLSCRECGGLCVDAPPPERRTSAEAAAALTVIATLPAEQAFVATGRLDAGEIGSSLRDATDERVDVLVSPADADRAREILRRPPRDEAHTRVLLAVLLVAGVALFLSAAMLVARWLLSGSPLPR